MFGYGGWSRGFKSGGWNGRAVLPESVQQTYDPEYVDTLEVGMRSEWLDNRVRINPTVFYSRYTDKQEVDIREFLNATDTISVNAARVTLYGAELEALARPVPAAQIRVTAGYVKNKYDKYELQDLQTGETVDVSSTAKLKLAPKFTASVGAQYTWPLNSGALTLSGDYSHTAKYFSATPNVRGKDPTGRDIIGSYDQANFAVSYETSELGTSG